MRNALIIGGGLAGTAAAIDLASAGHAPLLLERESAPHDKICGEFLSGEAVAALVALGVDPVAHGAVPITRVHINAGRRHVAAQLPFPALSLTRRVLDEALLARAAQAGVAVQRGVTVRGLSGTIAHTSAGDISAPTVLTASGKHDIRGHARPAGGHFGEERGGQPRRRRREQRQGGGCGACGDGRSPSQVSQDAPPPSFSLLSVSPITDTTSNNCSLNP
jgi:2-polyprenyl-6-methoxyphenol hydroxylase-like FAD-dependent oxidoreductase